MSGSRGAPAPWAFEPIPRHGRTWGIRASVRYCRALASAHYENFPVALSLMGRRRVEALAAVYAFARQADDFADEPEFEGTRIRLLDAWEDQLHRSLSGEVSHPVFVALHRAMRDFDLPVEPFLDLLDAFRQDCGKTRYESFDDVLDYCRRSADPVGRIMLRVLGLDGDDFTRWSDSICTALQLTNFWQDLSVDLPRDRLYLPLEDLRRFAVPVESLFQGNPPPSFNDLLRFELDRTRSLFSEGLPLLAASGFPGVVYFSAVWMGGRAVLELVGLQGRSILSRRPALDAGTMLRTLVSSGGRPWIP
ncbi:MAG: squalene synthase HpnC [Deltaproteobacteria bacterium]|nr:squalene synthase HpnC [Deltaproteobacteria bacterium]